AGLRGRGDGGVRDLRGGVLVLRTRKSDAAAKQTLVGVGWAGAGYGDDDRPDQKGKEHRPQGYGHALRDALDGCQSFLYGPSSLGGGWGRAWPAPYVCLRGVRVGDVGWWGLRTRLDVGGELVHLRLDVGRQRASIR